MTRENDSSLPVMAWLDRQWPRQTIGLTVKQWIWKVCYEYEYSMQLTAIFFSISAVPVVQCTAWVAAALEMHSENANADSGAT